MAFNPAVIMIEKKPQPQNTTNMASNNKPPNTTSESESDSDEDSSDDDSSDETKKSSITKPPTVNIIFWKNAFSKICNFEKSKKSNFPTSKSAKIWKMIINFCFVKLKNYFQFFLKVNVESVPTTLDTNCSTLGK